MCQRFQMFVKAIINNEEWSDGNVQSYEISEEEFEFRDV